MFLGSWSNRGTWPSWLCVYKPTKHSQVGVWVWVWALRLSCVTPHQFISPSELTNTPLSLSSLSHHITEEFSCLVELEECETSSFIKNPNTVKVIIQPRCLATEQWIKGTHRQMLVTVSGPFCWDRNAVSCSQWCQHLVRQPSMFDPWPLFCHVNLGPGAKSTVK